ncbi:MAG TPA: helix-turn-helix transcriptional regulator [Thermoclostridium sp.]
METYSTFGECLAAILNALDLKCSKLAKEINVDPSLIYKWLRGERVPSYDTTYIEQISNYIANKISNSFQRKAITDLLSGYGINVSEMSNTGLKNKIMMWLQEAQGYSIKLHKKMISEKKYKIDSVPNITNLIKNIDTGTKQNHGKANIMNHDPGINGNLFNDNVQVITGHEEVIYSMLKLLKQAHRKPDSYDDKILITFNSETGILFDDMDLKNKCIHALYCALSHGWNIIFLIRLSNNNQRTIRIIEDLQVLLPHGNLMVYYYHKACDDIFALNDLCIVPHTGALLGFCSKIGQQVDRAFLHHEKTSVDTLTSYFFQQLTFAKPLLKAYPSYKTPEFQQALVEADEIPGDKYVFKNGLSTVTIPLNLYEKYLNLGNRTEQEISYRKFMHKKRLESFESQVKYYEFRDICFIESLEMLVKNKKYTFDEYYMLENRTISNEDIVCHLENLINMLEKYDNYEVAFVSKQDFISLSNICWLVKRNSGVFIETLNNDKLADNNNPEMNFIITEKSIVNAFHDYFLKLWCHIPDKNKDKRNSINYLQLLINKINTEDKTR